MTREPHLQADMLKVIADDASLVDKVEMFSEVQGRWIPVMSHVIMSEPHRKYRIKPREFKEGYFYPVIFRLSCDSTHMLQYNSGGFRSTNGHIYNKDNFKFIGEGYLPDFGENNDE